MSEEEAEQASWERIASHLAQAGPDASTDTLTHLARAIAGSGVPAGTCAAVEALLPAYVEAEVARTGSAARFPAVQRHLDLCAACEALYLELLELAVSPVSGEVSVTLPPPDLSFLPLVTLPTFVQEAAGAVVRARFPRQKVALQGVMRPFFDALQRAGRDHRFQPQPTLAGAPSATQLLVVTYEATRATSTAVARGEIALDQKPEALVTALRAVAATEAARQGLGPEDVGNFAESFSEWAARTPHLLRHLADG